MASRCSLVTPHQPHRVELVLGQLGHGGADMSYDCPGVSVADAPVAVVTAHRRLARKLEEAAEAVNHPAHYGGADDPYEVIKVIDAWGLGFALGNAVKYIARAGKKDPTKHLEDLRKAVFYLEHEIKLLEEQKGGDGANPR